MRELADAERIRLFMRAFGAEADAETRAYFTDGATPILLGWRRTTIDIDIKIVPERDHLLRSLPHIKEQLRVNVELASPVDFVPVPPGWEDRSRFEAQEGHVAYYHFDLYAQALAKVEQGLSTRSRQTMVTAAAADPGRRGGRPRAG